MKSLYTGCRIATWTPMLPRTIRAASTSAASRYIGADRYQGGASLRNKCLLLICI